MTEVVHIAAPEVQVGHRLRQRCSWCGAMIDDVDLSTIQVAVAEGEEPSPYPSWPAGALVAVDGGIRYVVEPQAMPDGSLTLGIPPTSCMALDPEVTGSRTP